MREERARVEALWSGAPAGAPPPALAARDLRLVALRPARRSASSGRPRAPRARATGLAGRALPPPLPPPPTSRSRSRGSRSRSRAASASVCSGERRGQDSTVLLCRAARRARASAPRRAQRARRAERRVRAARRRRAGRRALARALGALDARALRRAPRRAARLARALEAALGLAPHARKPARALGRAAPAARRRRRDRRRPAARAARRGVDRPRPARAAQTARRAARDDGAPRHARRLAPPRRGRGAVRPRRDPRRRAARGRQRAAAQAPVRRPLELVARLRRGARDADAERCAARLGAAFPTAALDLSRLLDDEDDAGEHDAGGLRCVVAASVPQADFDARERSLASGRVGGRRRRRLLDRAALARDGLHGLRRRAGAGRAARERDRARAQLGGRRARLSCDYGAWRARSYRRARPFCWVLRPVRFLRRTTRYIFTFQVAAPGRAALASSRGRSPCSWRRLRAGGQLVKVTRGVGALAGRSASSSSS